MAAVGGGGVEGGAGGLLTGRYIEAEPSASKSSVISRSRQIAHRSHRQRSIPDVVASYQECKVINLIECSDVTCTPTVGRINGVWLQNFSPRKVTLEGG